MNMGADEPTSAFSWRPALLPAATRGFREKARNRGLLDSDLDPLTTTPDLEARAARLSQALARLGRVRMGSRDMRRLPALMAWLYDQERHDVIGAVAQAACDHRLNITTRTWWALVVYSFDMPLVLERLQRELAGWSARRLTRLVRGVIDASHLRELRALPGALATAHVLSGGFIDNALAMTGVSAVSPFGRAFFAVLVSEAAAPWLSAHPMSRLAGYLRERQESRTAGLIGRRLLEPAHQAGLAPEDVAVAQDFARVVELVYGGLGRPGSPAWNGLGPNASEVIRWWRVQRQLQEFFETWHADPERKDFWLGYIRHISDVEVYRRATALAMRIGQCWFIEFGFTGNAAYAYTNDEWERMEGRRRNATSPSALKVRTLPLRMSPVQHLVSRRRSHHTGWQARGFPEWIAGWSGVWP